VITIIKSISGKTQKKWGKSMPMQSGWGEQVY